MYERKKEWIDESMDGSRGGEVDEVVSSNVSVRTHACMLPCMMHPHMHTSTHGCLKMDERLYLKMDVWWIDCCMVGWMNNVHRLIDIIVSVKENIFDETIVNTV